MPIYEYRCPSCGNEFEKLLKMSDPTPVCPDCGEAEVKKMVSAAAFVLKGGGWYADGYTKANGGGSAKSGDAGGGSAKGAEAGGTGGSTPKADSGGSSAASSPASGGTSSSSTSTSDS